MTGVAQVTDTDCASSHSDLMALENSQSMHEIALQAGYLTQIVIFALDFGHLFAKCPFMKMALSGVSGQGD